MCQIKSIITFSIMVLELQFFLNFIFSCKICGMNYHQHMMHGHGTIRTHLYTHFGPDLNKMVIETPEGKFKCPEPGCGYEKAEKGSPEVQARLRRELPDIPVEVHQGREGADVAQE